MSYLKDKFNTIKRRLKESRTVRLAFLKKLVGLAIMNIGYFEDSMTAMAFGLLTMALGMLDYQLRLDTSKELK